MIIGYLSLFIYILTISLSTVFLDQIGNNYNFWFTLLITQLAALIVFNLINYKVVIESHLKALKFKKEWLLTNISILFVTALSYYTVINSSADFVIAVFFLANAILAAFFAKDYFKTIVCTLTLLICFLADGEVSFFVFICSVLAGFFSYFYSIISNEFIKKAELKVSAFLSLRFYIIIFIALVGLVHYSGLNSLHYFHISSLCVLSILGLANIVIPVYFSQKSLFLLGVKKFSYTVTFLPIITYFIESIVKNDFPVYFFLACLLTTVALNYDVVKNWIKK
ncbi:MAG: hypothetical protein Kow0076_8350 [Francisella sp.]